MQVDVIKSAKGRGHWGDDEIHLSCHQRTNCHLTSDIVKSGKLWYFFLKRLSGWKATTKSTANTHFGSTYVVVAAALKVRRTWVDFNHTRSPWKYVFQFRPKNGSNLYKLYNCVRSSTFATQEKRAFRNVDQNDRILLMGPEANTFSPIWHSNFLELPWD